MAQTKIESASFVRSLARVAANVALAYVWFAAVLAVALVMNEEARSGLNVIDAWGVVMYWAAIALPLVAIGVASASMIASQVGRRRRLVMIVASTLPGLLLVLIGMLAGGTVMLGVVLLLSGLGFGLTALLPGVAGDVEGNGV